jgi:carbamoyltransferase
MKILGISAFYHDSAAALVEDGSIVAAAEEERFSRTKHDARFPDAALRYCLNQRGLQLRDIDHVVFYDKPGLKLQRLVCTFLAAAPAGFAQFSAAAPSIGGRLFQRQRIIRALQYIGPFDPSGDHLLFCEHHLSHAASAYYPSPFESAAVLTLDGAGEWCTTSAATGNGASINIYKEIHFPHSLGLLYSAFTAHAGFKVNSGEYKLMGLAAYGKPVHAQQILDNLIEIKADGSFRLNMEYFGYCAGLSMTTPAFEQLFGGPARAPEAPIEQRLMDLAASIQVVLEEVICRMASGIAKETGMQNLCLAGGVALNCVANARLAHERIFRRLWIQPAAGDSGGAIGAALAAYYLYCKGKRHAGGECDAMSGALLGPAFSQGEIETALRRGGGRFTEVNDAALVEACVSTLCEGKAVGWFQGRMEFGPRALGSRSILADPRPEGMRTMLNEKVKLREAFRPFAPVIRSEIAPKWFGLDCESPYMLLVARVQDGREYLPAITHVDRSARVQTVRRETNPLLHDLLQAFEAKTGCPVLVNTSFNVRGEPIVCTPEDAFRCFMGSGLDALAIGNCFLEKAAQDRDRHRSDARVVEFD